VITRGLSVRETEAIVKRIVEGPALPPRALRPEPADLHTPAAQDRHPLTHGTRVRIIRRGVRGRIEVDFTSEDELIRLYEQLTDVRRG
jgi:ParB family chromosome partitioning protein